MTIQRVAMLSVHGSPLGAIGGKDAGGMNVYLGELGRELAKRGIEVDIFTRASDEALPEVVEPVPNLRIVHVWAGPIAPVDKNQIFEHLPEFLNNLRSWVTANRPNLAHGAPYDILHAHYWLSAWVGDKLARTWHVPWAAMYHTLGRIKLHHRVGETESELRIDIERKTLAAVDAVVSGSETERRQIARLYGIPVQKIVRISPGVDLTRFRAWDRDESRALWGSAPDERVVLFVGRIEPLKGIDILIRAAGAMENKERLKVWIVGGDEAAAAELRRLTDLARRLGVLDHIRFFGSVPHDQLPRIYAAADVCVVPSYYESFGMVALESLACGTPVIASRVGGLQETVHDGENGYLLSWRCPEPFAEKLETLLDNPGLRQSFSRAALATARYYSWPAIADRILELYGCLIDQRSLRGIGRSFEPCVPVRAG
jgi:D-inositol-3-phosphate glycosyltransferase